MDINIQEFSDSIDGLLDLTINKKQLSKTQNEKLQRTITQTFFKNKNIDNKSLNNSLQLIESLRSFNLKIYDNDSSLNTKEIYLLFLLINKKWSIKNVSSILSKPPKTISYSLMRILHKISPELKCHGSKSKKCFLFDLIIADILFDNNSSSIELFIKTHIKKCKYCNHRLNLALELINKIDFEPIEKQNFKIASTYLTNNFNKNFSSTDYLKKHSIDLVLLLLLLSLFFLSKTSTVNNYLIVFSKKFNNFNITLSTQTNERLFLKK